MTRLLVEGTADGKADWTEQSKPPTERGFEGPEGEKKPKQEIWKKRKLHPSVF